ncbi:hypothetical protein BDR05DRAFT_999694 [Suillus weaverae]|nr:hypothetical protein BDR05DRAFT_999694 [Suillus weaverae]
MLTTIISVLPGVEVKYYDPLIKAINIALGCLDEAKVDGMCAAVPAVDMICRQNDIMLQAHQTVTSTGKPDLLILPFNSACTPFETNNKDAEKDCKKRDGKRKAHMDENAIESPKTLPWKDILACIKVKRKKKSGTAPSPSSYKAQDHVPTKEHPPVDDPKAEDPAPRSLQTPATQPASHTART